jgi:transcriptional regulator of arginine metabolism
MEVMKQLRHRAIRDLVASRPIRTQQELATALRELPIEVREAGLLAVVRTLPGSAHAIAAALDRARWPEVAGSIAGDDTVFVACRDRTGLRRVIGRIREHAG